LSQADTTDHFVKTGGAALPIFFLQLGSKTSLFFDKVLKQATLTNGTENVFVLTDVNFDQYKGYNCIDISQYAYGSKEFDGLYQHHSANPYFFEKTCFDRWFMISAMVKALNISHFFYADCDVLIMEDLKPIQERIITEGYEGSTMYFESEDGYSVTSAHTSFWSSSLLDNFCSFICKKYSDKAAFGRLLKDTLAGKYLNNTNVSDMILLDAFRTETHPRVINLFTLEDNNICFDFNANVAYNGHTHTFVLNPVHHVKKLTRRGRSIYGRVKGSSADILYCKFYTIHFQGYVTKTLIPVYATALTKKEAIKNRILGEYNFAVRKMKLLKNDLKRKALNLVVTTKSI
jgi:hypothetical protein